MKVSVYAPRGRRPADCGPGEAPVDYVDAMIEALKADDRHALEIRSTKDDAVDCDVAIFWSHKHRHVIEHQRAMGRHYLVMERGYLGNRKRWTSLGWDGLNGRALFPHADLLGHIAADIVSHPSDHRLNQILSAEGLMIEPYKLPGDGQRALIIGQVQGDAATAGVNLEKWYELTRTECLNMQMPVTFRPHPNTHEGRTRGVTLAEDLAGAQICVTFNSTAAVEAIMAGVPTIAYDPGSIAWEARHRPRGEDQPLDRIYPPTMTRGQWLAQLAWKQWTIEEIRSGTAWEVVWDAARGAWNV